MIKTGVLFFLMSFVVCGFAQESEFYRDFKELTDTKPIDQQAWDKCKKTVEACWGSTDVRYSKTNVPSLRTKEQTWRTTAWKGEKVNAQAVIWATRDCGNVSIATEALKGAGGSTIPVSAIKASFVRYTMTDELNKDKRGTCGYRPDRTVFDSSLVADILDTKNMLPLEARTTRPVWVSIRIPAGTPAGIYKGKIRFEGENVKIPALDIEVKVTGRTLPAPQERAFRLDLWQNPFAAARYYNVPLWSDKHLEAMRPDMQILADAGQKIITATIMHKPWGGQTEDHFEPMIMRIKKTDGTWMFDYAVFDKWVNFMMGMGIDRQINCYTLIPWNLSFQYFDQSSNSLKFVDAKVGSPEFNAYWTPFLTDFARHLKAKGWFDITTIAMDERPMKQMRQVIDLVKQADPDFKIALAGNYHDELEADLYDYCIASGQFFPSEVLKARKAAGKVSTYYTCCSEAYPNTFTFSPPAEAAWLGWYAAAKDFDGYLRWAYNSWVKEPLSDSRFRAFGGGDCYLVYPAGRSSIRMERLVEGIQDFEKIRILREEYKANPEKLKNIDEILSPFDIPALPDLPAAGMVKKAREALNKL